MFQLELLDVKFLFSEKIYLLQAEETGWAVMDACS